jgi:hypothetical protein
MSDPRSQGPFGTVYFPKQDTPAMQPGDGRLRPSQLAPLPRCSSG